MKIVHLELLAYGPFTRQSLRFSLDGYGLHLIYGPNEAGKSTTLRALRRLLYGIPASCEDDFLHTAGDLRIGAVLEDERGTLACIRRKGNKNTKGSLRDSDDEAILDTGRLDEMLGGLDEDAFRCRFGIDYKELVKGGQQVVAGEGDLGQILFAAASGVADLGEVLRRLDQDEEEVFKPRGSTPPLNKALAELKEAKKRLDRAELSVKTWQAKQHDFEVAEEKRKAIEEELRTRQAEHKRVDSYILVQPDLQKQKALLKERSELIGVPLLPEGFSSRRQAAQDELIRARTQVDSAERELAAIAGELASIELRDDLLAEDDAIRKLQETLGSHKQAMADRPELAAQRESLHQEAQGYLRELPGGDIEKLHVRQMDRIRIQELASEHAALQSQHQAAEKSLARIEGDISRCAIALQSLSTGKEDGSLRHLLKRALPKADLDSRAHRLEREIRQANSRLSDSLARLGLWQGDAEALLRLALPPLEAVDRFDGELRALQAQVTVASGELAKSKRELAVVEVDIEHLRRSGQVLALEDLQGAREERGKRWQSVKEKLLGERASSKSAETAARELEESTAKADDLADRMRREAEQVAQLAELQNRRDKLDGSSELLAGELVRQQDSLAQVSAEWQALWQPLDIQPLSPAEMRGWLSRVQELVRQAEGLARQEEEHEQVVKEAASLRGELIAELALHGQPQLLADEPLAHLFERADQLQERLVKASTDRKQLQKQLETAEQQRYDAAREAALAETSLAAWKEHWRKATGPLGLAEDASCGQVVFLLSQADNYHAKLREAEGLSRRIADIDAHAEKFARMLADLLSRLAPELAGSSPDVAVFELRKLYEASARALSRRENLLSKQLALSGQLARSKNEVVALEKQLAAMCREAGCDDIDALPNIIRQAEHRRQIEKELHEVEKSFYRFPESLPFDDFVFKASSQPAEEWHRKRDELAIQIAELDARRDDELNAAQAARSELKAMDGGAAAAEAEEEIQHLLARIRTLAEEYSRLKLAGFLLRKAIDTYRDKNQGPVLSRASELFRDLTSGSFVALQPKFDEKGNPVLVGVRHDGDHVEVAGMSDGTCDQLYLALRLASLEMHVRDHRPIPFIVDDILINFDDIRAIAALKALAQLGRHTQVIFFTHHEHLLSLAEEHLERGEFFTHRLPGRNSLERAASDVRAPPLAVG
jgi:uncharacterized protein YhaN